MTYLPGIVLVEALDVTIFHNSQIYFCVVSDVTIWHGIQHAFWRNYFNVCSKKNSQMV